MTLDTVSRFLTACVMKPAYETNVAVCAMATSLKMMARLL